MKILMLSWEYPPKAKGEVADYVYNLSRELVSLGHEVDVITLEEGVVPVYEEIEGVKVHRVTPCDIATEDFTKWIMHLNFSMIEEGTRLINREGNFDIIHCHDWNTAYAAKVLKWSHNIPLISTIHGTEVGRSNGIKNATQRYIASVEWLLTYESTKIVACDNYMEEEIQRLFSLPMGKVTVIPKGIYINSSVNVFDKKIFKNRFASEDEKIVLFVGNLNYDKGIPLLIESARMILNERWDVKFVVVGTGDGSEELKSICRRNNIENKVLFTGELSDEDKERLYNIADVTVFPGTYKPFGKETIDAMLAGCPVVVADTEKVVDPIIHKVNGLKMLKGNPESLKDNINIAIDDSLLRPILVENAKEMLKSKYSWKSVAKEIESRYKDILEEVKGTNWSREKVVEVVKDEIESKNVILDSTEVNVIKKVEKIEEKEAKIDVPKEEPLKETKSLKKESKVIEPEEKKTTKTVAKSATTRGRKPRKTTAKKTTTAKEKKVEEASDNKESSKEEIKIE
ncbi:glycosyltransferase family 4 protein [uncultured Clostridium sp.]|uniref:glycosyltransferase family 4 protein n=1 Tax=uncultured Clostridium sp. TaxID=59620 RepID=UPI0025FC7678|nr:glycosyltransferase family 4 protein [uncultured Clostridium sp.]